MAAEGEGNTQTSDTVSKEDYDKALDRARRFEARFTDLEKKWEKVKDIDPERVAADREALETLMKQQGTNDKAQIDELLARKEKEYKDTYGKQLEEKDTRLKDAETKLQRLEVVNPSLRLAADLFNSTELDILEGIIEKNLRKVDGEIVAVGPDGKPRPSKKDPRKDMTAQEFLEDFAEAHPSMAKARTSPGGGETGTVTGSNGAPSKYENLSIRDLQNMPRSEIDKIDVEILKKITANL